MTLPASLASLATTSTSTGGLFPNLSYPSNVTLLPAIVDGVGVLINGVPTRLHECSETVAFAGFYIGGLGEVDGVIAS